MVRLSDLPAGMADRLRGMAAEPFDSQPFVENVVLSKARIAIVTTAGLHLREQARFDFGDAGYRVLPGKCTGADLIMSQLSVGFDRTGFVQDVNTVFPIDRLRELEQQGSIGSLADFHYSMSSAFNDPFDFESTAEELAGLLKADRIDAAVLVPV